MKTQWRIIKEDDRFYPQKKKNFLGIEWWSYEIIECGMMDTAWSFETEEKAREYINYQQTLTKPKIINV